jgi:streptomycin 6-kinase
VTLRIPRNLADAARDEHREEWLDELPVLVAHVTKLWSLEIGEPFDPGGRTAWVAPATSADDDRLVVKIAWPHVEAIHEADGLRAWDGNAAVRLHATTQTDHSVVLLLERCTPGETLKTRPELEQDAVVTSLLRRLWQRPSGDHPFRSLRTMCELWADEFERKEAAGRVTLDSGLVRDGMALFRSLPSSAAVDVLLCTDLHAGNILSSQREPWLVIDPKPYVGDPTYDPLQHMLNSGDRLRADPTALADRMAALLDLDRDRLRLWLFARCVQESPDWPGLADVARALAP